MNLQEYEAFERIRLMHDAVKVAGRQLSDVKDHTGISPREAFIMAFSEFRAQDVRALLAEANDAHKSAKAEDRVLAIKEKVNRTLARGANADDDALAVVIANSSVADPEQQGLLAQAVRVLLIAQMGIALILKIISTWLDTNVTFVEAMRQHGVTDTELADQVMRTGIR